MALQAHGVLRPYRGWVFPGEGHQSPYVIVDDDMFPPGTMTGFAVVGCVG